MTVRDIVERFGGLTTLAKSLGVGPSTISYWLNKGIVPWRRRTELLDLAKRLGIELLETDFEPSPNFKNEVGAVKALVDNSLAPQFQVEVGSVQRALPFYEVSKTRTIGGLEMGVLGDGTAYLDTNSLASLCGISSTSISNIRTEFDSPEQYPRIKAIRSIIEGMGITPTYACYQLKLRTTKYAFPDYVCLAVLEYYALDANPTTSVARQNFRKLAGHALREFIYSQVGYDPNGRVGHEWKQFHDRVGAAYQAVPVGYFSIFKESADLIVALILNGAQIDDNFVPDISMGKVWGTYWNANNFDAKYGVRRQYEHNYPEYFKQAASNPQPVHCYPEAALGEFRRWYREQYIGEGKLRNYLNNKAAQKELPTSFVELVLDAVEPKKLN